MKSSSIPCRSVRAGSIRIGLTILSFVLSGGIAIAQPAPDKTPNKTPEKTPENTPTPNPKLDPKTEAELLQAEDRFIIAIRNGDAKALEELLDDHYFDSFANSEKAISKRGVLVRLRAGRLPFYRVEMQPKLSRSVDTFTVEGLAREGGREISVDYPKEEWVRVQRLWIRSHDHWLLRAQIITPENEKESEKEPK